jgi:Zn-finger nucleic acid-binding protein
MMSGNPSFDCPRCGVTLTMSERQGIEIDYCPQCRGVWLDRGELDKIIERAEVGQPPPPAQAAVSLPVQPSGTSAGGWTQPIMPPQQQPWHRGDHNGDDRRDSYSHGHHPKKRKGWLGELFD